MNYCVEHRRSFRHLQQYQLLSPIEMCIESPSSSFFFHSKFSVFTVFPRNVGDLSQFPQECKEQQYFHLSLRHCGFTHSSCSDNLFMQRVTFLCGHHSGFCISYNYGGYITVFYTELNTISYVTEVTITLVFMIAYCSAVKNDRV